MTQPTYPSADAGVAALVDVLGRIDLGRPSRAVMGSGHYANVLALDERRGLALSTDGVGTKLLVAKALGRFGTVGIDCVAMNVNDIVCVGAEPIAMLDYIAVVDADPAVLADVAEGLRRGAEDAGVEIPGGELAVVPDMVKGLDLVGACVGTVDLAEIVMGSAIEPGDAVIGLPASGVHSNGLTLARRALPDLDEQPEELGGASVGETLLEPTVIYVRAVLALLALRGARARPRPHHRRWAAQPAPAGGGGRLLDLVALAPAARLRPHRFAGFGFGGRHARGVQPGVWVLLCGAPHRGGQGGRAVGVVPSRAPR